MTKSPKPRILCNCHIMTLVPSWTTKTDVVAQQVAQRRNSGGRTIGMVAQGLYRSPNGGRVVATVIAQWTLLVGQMRHNGCTRKAGARRPNWYTLTFVPLFWTCSKLHGDHVVHGDVWTFFIPPLNDQCNLWALCVFSGNLASFVVAQGRHTCHRPRVKGALMDSWQ